MIISTSESSELEGGMSLSRVFVFPGDDRKEVLAKTGLGKVPPTRNREFLSQYLMIYNCRSRALVSGLYCFL